MDHDPTDLDALIGDIRQEAARRRASPGFPLDAEARLGDQLDASAPGSGADRLLRITSELEGLASQPSDRRRWRRRDRDDSARLAQLAAAGFALVGSRLADTEARFRRLTTPFGAGTSTAAGPRKTGAPAGSLDTGSKDAGSHDAGPPAATVLPLIDAWLGRLADHHRTPAGPTLVAAEHPGVWFEHLPGALGLAPGAGDEEDPTVRRGGIVDHLGRMGDGSLGLTVVADPYSRPGGDQAEPLTRELARTSRTVAVVSVAPWHWALALDPVSAELELMRPLSAEVWIALLTRAGLVATADYGPGGSSYLVWAERAP